MYDSFQRTAVDPIRGFRVITKSDSTDLATDATAVRGLYVGTGGDLYLKFVSDPATYVMKNVPSGTAIGFIGLSRVMLATTAADILGIL